MLVKFSPLFLSVIMSLALADELPLSLAEAQALAVLRSHQLPAQDFAILASQEMAIAAAQLPDPVLTLGIDNLPLNGADRLSLSRDFMTMRRLGVMQELTRNDKLQARAERYQRVADKSVAEKNLLKASLQRDVALAWLDRYYAEQIALLASEQLAQAQLEIAAAESAYRAGRGTQADLLAARAGYALLADRDSEAQRRVRNARLMLSRWTGVAGDRAIAGLPDLAEVKLNPALLDSQLAHHPQMAVYRQQEQIAEAEAKLAQANRQADWSVEVAYQQRGPAYANMLSVGLSLPFQWDQKNRQDRELSAKLAMLEQARAERAEMLRDHIALTGAMLNEWDSNRARLARYQSELLPLAEQRTQSMLAAYRGAKASLAELLAVRRNQLELRSQFIQLQADTARLWAQLNFQSADEAPVATSAISKTMYKDMP